jgi:succinate dehydrogenase/fumarate reductase cytochrome b subunit
MGIFSVIFFVILFVYFVIHIAYGISHFVDIAHGKALNPQNFNHDYNIILQTLTAGLLTELVIALREPLAKD